MRPVYRVRALRFIISYVNEFEQNNSSFSHDWRNIQMQQLESHQPLAISQQPFSTPFLSKLWRESETHSDAAYIPAPIYSNIDSTSFDSKLSSSLPNHQEPKVENSTTTCCSSQQRLNDLETQCKSLQQQIQNLRSSPTGLTEDQKNIEVILNELQDELGLSDIDNQFKKYTNQPHPLQGSMEENLPKQNNTFLSVPHVSHSTQSSMDSGLGFPDMTSLLGTSPFGSRNDIHATSSTNYNEKPFVTNMDDNNADTKRTESANQFDLQM